MTETTDAVIHEALSVIDKALSQMMSRTHARAGHHRSPLSVRAHAAALRLRRYAANKSLKARTKQSCSSVGSVTAAVSMLTPMSRLWL